MGSRVVASLLALNLGAGPMLIGVLIAAYSIFQLAFALVVGRISDRYGSRRPMLGGAIAFGCGLIIPAVSPTLPALFISAPLIGIGFVFFNVAAQNLAGTLGSAEERTRNFSTMSLGYSSGHMIGPVLAGIMIDRYGFGAAYIAFAVLTLAPILALAVSRQLGAHGARSEPTSSSAFDLMRLPSLRRMIIVSGLVTTGWDLYTFYVPIYGHSIGLSASTIGTILGAFAAASFIVRVALPVLTRRFSVETVLASAMCLAALLFLPFTFITFVPALPALFVKPPASGHETRVERAAHARLTPIVRQAIARPVAVAIGAAVALLIGLVIFFSLGREFIPTLDEGDLLIEARRLTGAALSESATQPSRARCGLGMTGIDTGASANGMASKPEMSTSETSFAVLKTRPADGSQPFRVAR